MVILIPQPNIFYKLYDMPGGKDLLDFLFVAVMIGIFVNKGGVERSGNSVLVIILVLVSYLAVWNSSVNFSLPYPLTTANPMLKVWKSYAYMVFMYLLTFNAIKDDENQRKMLLLTMAFVLLFISIRSYRSFTAGPSFSETSRSTGPFWAVGLGPNHFGAFIVHYTAVFLGLLLLDKIRWHKILFLSTVLISLHPLFFSYSRGAYVAALAVLVYFGLAKKRSLLILAVVLVIAWQTILPSSVVERITMTKTEEGQIERSAAIRLDLWDHAVTLFEKKPVFGIGFGGYEFTMPEGVFWTDTHNYYLKMLSEQGIIGLGLLLTALFLAFRSGWKLVKVGRNGFERGLGFGFAGCVIACACTNFFGDRWSYYEIGSYFWVLWGLVDRYIIVSRESDKVGEE
jgi:O-antigen ligase